MGVESILILGYKRPDHLRKVLEAVQQYNPKRLYINIDGPKSEKDVEANNKCKELYKDFQWDCEVLLNYQSENKGLAIAPVMGIDWFFEHEERGIILEDDCLPIGDFFSFMEAMLSKYHDDNRVLHISGFNHGIEHGYYDYFFCYMYHIWGWATWRRAWKNFDADYHLLDDIDKYTDFSLAFGNEYEGKRRMRNWKANKHQQIVTWDYKWSYSCVVQGGLSIVPSPVLIENIGEGEGSTNFANKTIEKISSDRQFCKPILHPPIVFPYLEAEKKYANKHTPMPPTISQKVRRKIRSLF